MLTQIEVHSSYWTHVFPPGLAIFGFGLGLLMVPMQNLALIGVPDHDAGAASALVNATLQIGGALGTALFTTIYASAKSAFTADNAAPIPPEGIPVDMSNATIPTGDQLALLPPAGAGLRRLDDGLLLRRRGIRILGRIRLGGSPVGDHRTGSAGSGPRKKGDLPPRVQSTWGGNPCAPLLTARG